MGNDDTQQILRSLIGAVNQRLDHLDDHIGEVKGDVKATRVAVERNSSDIQNLYRDQGHHNKAITALANTQANCQARKNQEAGALPGTTTDKQTNTIAIISTIIALTAVIVAIVLAN